jgi:hypothetical protein
MGADVRLVLPGERCLLCLGGLADLEGARRVLASADAEQAFHAGRDWRRERAGSLRSLNHLAASVALRLWEDLVAGLVRASTWTHIEFDPSGRLTVSHPSSHLPFSGISGRDDADPPDSVAGQAEFSFTPPDVATRGQKQLHVRSKADRRPARPLIRRQVGSGHLSGLSLMFLNQ